jgi:hypothetical protein
LLLEQKEHPLHSEEDYGRLLERLGQKYPELAEYSRSNILFAIGDHPTFFFLKRMVAKGSIPIKVMPRLGPFHIWLNIVEDAGLMSHIYTRNCMNVCLSLVSRSNPKSQPRHT